MTVKLKTAYALLLILVLTALMIPTVGETQARYENTQVWNTVLTDLPDQVSSNLLSGDSRRPVTILLEEMEEENDVLYVDITLQSGVKTEGVLHWSNYYPYFISAEMYLNEQKLEDGVILTVTEAPLTLTLKLVPTEEAFAEPRAAQIVQVDVTWGNTLEGTFQTTLAEIPEPVTEPATEPTTAPDAEPDSTEPSEAEEETAADTQTEETEPAPVEETVPVVVPTVQAEAPGTYPAEGELNLKITPSLGVTRMQLGLLEITPASETRTGSMDILPMPEYTRFRYGEAAMQYMLAQAGMLNMDFTPGQTMELRLDLSRTTLAGKELSLVLIYYGEGPEPLNLIPLSSAAQAPAPEYKLDSRVLSSTNAITMEIPAQWVSILTAKTDDSWWEIEWWNGSSYVPVFYLKPVVNVAGQQLEIACDQANLPLAGTYRLTIRVTDGNTPVGEAQDTFFVVYSDYTEIIETGGAEQ
jgi:hypothetical protein